MKPFKVYVALDTESSHGRRILKGIIQYNTSRTMPWILRWGDMLSQEEAETQDGLILAISSLTRFEQALSYRCPVMNVSCHLEISWPYTVIPDNRAIGRMAGTFLSERLYTHMAVVGHSGHAYSISRQEGFTEQVSPLPVSYSEGVSEDGPEDLHDFIGGLPSGTGVFATNDVFGRQVIEACRVLNKHIPGDIAVLGVDVEEEMGISAGIALSSVDPDAQALGEEAARLLDQRLMHRDVPDTEIRIPPLRVMEQQSTGYYEQSDPALQTALAFIDANVGTGIQVDDVVKAAGIGRRTLEIRFRNGTGQSILERIRTRRIARAEFWLRTTSIPVGDIAHRCGFSDVYYFSNTFKKLTGANPTTYRRSHHRL